MMYSINIDSNAKLIKIDLSGYMDSEEAEAYATEVISLLSQLKEKEYSMYVDVRRLDPVSQDSVLFLIEVTKNCLLSMTKIAAVHNRTVMLMQAKRIEVNAKVDNNIENKVVRFKSPGEAMSYLNR